MKASREWIAIVALLVAMCMATGPGVLLVNRPTTLFGLPLIYAWGIVWFLIIGGIALATDAFIWRADSQEETKEDRAREDDRA